MYALALVCASSVAAVSITFDGEVLRYREHPGEQANFGDFVVGVGLITSTAPPFLRVYLAPLPFDDPIESVHVGSGCQNAGSGSSDPRVASVRVHCPLSSASIDQVRYRFTLGVARDVTFQGPRLRGVVYARGGADDVSNADRVYGGPGDDALDGARVYGGPGQDIVSGNTATTTDGPVVYGGPGYDLLSAPGLLYGGPKNDVLEDSVFSKSADMMVGGPGRDIVRLARDRRRDVVQVRGGGVDYVNCREHPDPGDALFVDRTDRLSPSCKDATVLYTERPRYPYP